MLFSMSTCNSRHCSGLVMTQSPDRRFLGEMHSQVTSSSCWSRRVTTCQTSLPFFKEDLVPLKSHSEKPLKWRYISAQHDSHPGKIRTYMESDVHRHVNSTLLQRLRFITQPLKNIPIPKPVCCPRSKASSPNTRPYP